MALTISAVQAFLKNEKLEAPVLKISNMKIIPGKDQSEKIRLILTDGVHSHSFVMLSTHLNDRVHSGEIAQDSIIRLDSYCIKEQRQNEIVRNIVMISALTVMQPGELENVPPQVKMAKLEVPHIQKQVLSSNVGIVPINLLNPYQNKWCIKGRVIQKEKLKTWKKPNSEGKLFSFTIADESCDVRITAFNQEVDKYFDLIEVDKTYTVTKGQVKVANRQYNNTKCDHEIALKSDSEITEVTGEMAIPAIKYEFVDIAHIKECAVDTMVDVIGVAHEIRDISTIITKTTNQEMQKRDLVLVDRSGGSINLTLWGDDINSVDNLKNPIVAVRGAMVKDFAGRSLNVPRSAILKINPSDMEEAATLLGWYEGGGRNERFDAQSSIGSFKPTKRALISELTCTEGDKGDYFTVSASIANIKKENMVYKACEKCNKKVVDLHNSLYKCERCNIESPNFKYRLMVNINVIDNSGGAWITGFQEAAEKVLGVSADAIGQFYENEDKESIEKIVNSILYREAYNLKVRVNNDTYNDETRMKISLIDASSMTILDEIAALTEDLKL